MALERSDVLYVAFILLLKITPDSNFLFSSKHLYSEIVAGTGQPATDRESGYNTRYLYTVDKVTCEHVDDIFAVQLEPEQQRETVK